tara:strand:+ start:395 stop:1096 length:702 start_codon:yes stop_codon:yes gene_type:complete
MNLFADALDILFRIEHEDNKLQINTNYWLQWYLKVFVKYLVIGGVITVLSVFIFSDQITAYVGTIAIGAPIMYAMIRLQFELKDIQKIQMLFSITFSKDGIEIEPIQKSTLTSFFLERPIRSREFLIIPTDAIIDIAICPHEDRWGDTYYSIITKFENDGDIAYLPLSPRLRKKEQLLSVLALIGAYYLQDEQDGVNCNSIRTLFGKGIDLGSVDELWPHEDWKLVLTQKENL